MIYLDYNATTPVAPEVAAAMTPYLGARCGNPSSTHALGKHMRSAVEHARQQVADLLGAEPEEIVFTSGGSESNNHALKGVFGLRARGHLIISAVEHPAIAVPSRWLQQRGFGLSVVGVDSEGLVDPDEVRDCLRADTVLISIMHANNEVGTIQPIAEIARVAREAGVLLHTDAAQAVGKIPTRVDELEVDLLSLAGHKLYAPGGIGALYVRKGVSKLESLIHGAGHEGGRRAGTEPVAAVVGLGAAAELAVEYTGGVRVSAMRRLRDRLHRALRAVVPGGAILNGHSELRLPNTLNVSFPGVLGPKVLEEAQDVCASAGAACHADRHEPSSVLTAMGVRPEVALGSVRFSLGRTTTEAQVDTGAARIADAVRRCASAQARRGGGG